MKTFFLIFVWMQFASNIFSQELDSPTKLAYDDNFINWIENATTKEWAVQLDMQNQLGDRIGSFKDALYLTETNEEVDDVFRRYGYDPEPGIQLMAEHLTYGLYFKQENPSLWRLESGERERIIKAAYYEGMNSGDVRWVKLKDNLMQQVFQHCGSTGRVAPTWGEIADCFWETISSIIGVVGNFAAVVSAINEGNWGATVTAIKRFLRSAGLRLGWFGLALAAADIALCLFS